MMTNSTYTGEYDVAPFAGAWIEIVRAAWLPCGRLRSLPSRERGLKCRTIALGVILACRSLRGSVD